MLFGLKIAKVLSIEGVNRITINVGYRNASKRKDCMAIVRVGVGLSRLIIEIERHVSSVERANV